MSTQSPVPIVTATASHERVRYICIGEVHQTRLQVFSATGEQVYDSDFKLGNLIDWKLQHQQGLALTAGTYLYLITIRDFSERITQKYGTAVIDEGQVYLEQPGRSELTSAQTATLEANRQADVLSAVDRIGVSAVNSSSTTSSTPTSTTGTEPSGTDNISTPSTGESNATGTGAQDYLSRWTDNIGTLGNSTLFQNVGKIGLGTTTPGGKFHVVGTQGSLSAGTFQLDTPVTFGSWSGAYPTFELVNANQTNNNVSLFQFADAPSGASHAGIGAVNTDHTNKWGNLFFYTKQADGYLIRMGIYGRNVGINTTTPASRLTVNGMIQTIGAGSGIKFPDGSVQTTADTGTGGLLAVTHNATLTGAGTNASPLGVAVPLTLSGSNANPILAVANTGSNPAISATGAINTSTEYRIGGQRVLSAPGDYNLFTGTGAGPPNVNGTGNSFYGSYAGGSNTEGHYNAFYGSYAGYFTTASNNTFVGYTSGFHTTTGSENVFIGIGAGYDNETGSNNTAIGTLAGSGKNYSNLTYATAIGAEAKVTASNTVQIGRITLDQVAIGALASASSTHVCINNLGVFASCSSSLRYKENVHSLTGGLSLIQRLRPVSFKWKERDEQELGLIAEEVAEIEPSLVFHNQKGEIEGVKYAQISALLINAVKEQQKLIEQQARRTEEQARRNEEQASQIAHLQAQLNQLKRTISRKRAPKR